MNPERETAGATPHVCDTGLLGLTGEDAAVKRRYDALCALMDADVAEAQRRYTKAQALGIIDEFTAMAERLAGGRR